MVYKIFRYEDLSFDAVNLTLPHMQYTINGVLRRRDSNDEIWIAFFLPGDFYSNGKFFNNTIYYSLSSTI